MVGHMPQDALTQNPSASDWMATRGEKWRANMLGMEAMLAPIDAPLLAALALDAPYRIADIGCGGGATALQILRHAAAGSEVMGFDISAPMIEAARARIPAGERALRFEVADMSSAAPPGERFQRVSSRFGVMFFADAAAAFANLRAWLVPGGRLAFAVWGHPQENRWLHTVREVVSAHVPLPAADPDAPGAFRYAEVEKLLGLLRAAGFVEVHAHEWCGEVQVGGRAAASEAAQFALTAFSSFAELLAAAGPEAQQRAHAELTARFVPRWRAGAVWMPARVNIVTALRP